MKKNMFKFCALFALMALLLCWSTAAMAEPKKVTWNFHTVLGKGDPLVEQGERWALNEMGKITSGKFEGVVFEKSALGFKGPDIPKVVGQGLLPIAEMWGAHVAGRWPWASVLGLPYLFDAANLDLSDHMMDAVWNDFAKPMEKENLILLGLAMLPSGRSFAVNKPLSKDPKKIFQGKKIRVSNANISWLVERLGGTPVSMPWSEVYEAAQRGIVDGIEFGHFGAFLKMKFNEVVKRALLTDAKSYIPFQVGSTVWMVVANKKKFYSLPPGWQRSLKDLFRLASKRFTRAYLGSVTDSVKACIVDKGMTAEIVTPETISYLKNKCLNCGRLPAKRQAPTAAISWTRP